MKYLGVIFGCINLLGMICLGSYCSVASAQEISIFSAAVQPVHLTPQQQAWTTQSQEWMNNLTTLKAKFQQIAPNGQRSTGTVWIKRPGRIRFEYNKPSKLLLVANEGKIVFHDGEVGQTTTIPIDQSPLGLLLKPALSFSGDVTMTNFAQGNAGTSQITVVRTASPADGSLTLVFNQKPIQLTAWRVVDAQGQSTQVDLYDIKKVSSISDSLFNIHIGDDD